MSVALNYFDFVSLFSRTKLVKNEPESLNDVDESSIGKANNSVVVIEVMDTSDEDDIGESNVNGVRNGSRMLLALSNGESIGIGVAVKGEPNMKIGQDASRNENQRTDHGRIER